MAFILAITNQKGGVGKTTTAVNLAAQLATSKRRVVLVDLDPQGNATSSLGIEKDQLQQTVYEALTGKSRIKEVILPTRHTNLFIVPANGQLAQAEVELVNVAKREYQLTELLASINADIIVIDCPPALGLLTINALTAADGAMIPVQAEYFALEGLSQLLQTIQLVRQGLNPRLTIFGVVLTMYTKRTVLSEQVKVEVEQHFGSGLFKTMIPRNIRLAEAPSFGKTIFEHDRWSKGARAYKALSAEVAERIAQR